MIEIHISKKVIERNRSNPHGGVHGIPYVQVVNPPTQQVEYGHRFWTEEGVEQVFRIRPDGERHVYLHTTGPVHVIDDNSGEEKVVRP